MNQSTAAQTACLIYTQPVRPGSGMWQNTLPPLIFPYSYLLSFTVLPFLPSMLLLLNFQAPSLPFHSSPLFLWTVELLHLLTDLRSGLRHFSLLRYNPHCSTRLCTIAHYKCIDWLIKQTNLQSCELPSRVSGKAPAANDRSAFCIKMWSLHQIVLLLCS